MQLLIDSTAVAVGAGPAAPTSGTPGDFTDGVPGSQPATTIQAYWMNMIQHELLNIVEAAGISPSASALNQVATAIQDLISTAVSPLATITALNNEISARAAAITSLTNLIATDVAPLASIATLNADIATLDAAIALLAPLAAPVLTKSGSTFPTTPTPNLGDTSTAIANMAALTAALTAVKKVGAFSTSFPGPWWQWDPTTGIVDCWGYYGTAITAEGEITISLPVNIGVFQRAEATGAQPNNTASTVVQVASWTDTSVVFNINDNQGNSSAALQGFFWSVRGYSAAEPEAV